jgi:nucleoside 2-deoxyribosyltransferase
MTVKGKKENVVRGALNGARCYLAGAIENTANSASWRKGLSKELKKLGIVCFDPTLPMMEGQRAESDEFHKQLGELRAEKQTEKLNYLVKPVMERDLKLVAISDFIIVFLKRNEKSWGTCHEIIYADFLKKPILLICEDGNVPFWLYGFDWIKTNLFYSTKECLEHLSLIDIGDRHFDNNYWKLLLSKYR